MFKNLFYHFKTMMFYLLRNFSKLEFIIIYLLCTNTTVMVFGFLLFVFGVFGLYHENAQTYNAIAFFICCTTLENMLFTYFLSHINLSKKFLEIIVGTCFLQKYFGKDYFYTIQNYIEKIFIFLFILCFIEILSTQYSIYLKDVCLQAMQQDFYANLVQDNCTFIEIDQYYEKRYELLYLPCYGFFRNLLSFVM